MKVFIEQTAESSKKNTALVYPYPYGYILDTKAPDGENLDCYVVTKRKVTVGSILECEPIGMVEWFENEQADHKIFASFVDEQMAVDDTARQRIADFANQFIVSRSDKQYRVGKFLGKEKAEALIAASRVDD